MLYSHSELLLHKKIWDVVNRDKQGVPKEHSFVDLCRSIALHRTESTAANSAATEQALASLPNHQLNCYRALRLKPSVYLFFMEPTPSPHPFPSLPSIPLEMQVLRFVAIVQDMLLPCGSCSNKQLKKEAVSRIVCIINKRFQISQIRQIRGSSFLTITFHHLPSNRGMR